MNKRISGTNYGKMTQINVTADLPSSASTPLKILTTGNLYAQICMYVSSPFFFTLADTDANGATRLGSDDTRCLMPAGLYTFPTAGEYTNSLYIKSSFAAVTDGVVYFIVEVD